MVAEAARRSLKNPAAILVNGALSDRVAALDRGLAFGDGAFRTLRVSGARPLNWARHYARLTADCEMLGLAVPAEKVWLAEIAQVAPREATLKLIVTRGVGGRGYRPSASAAPTRIVVVFAPPDYPPGLARDGVRVRRCELVLCEQPRLAGAKTLNRLENVLARGEWDDEDIREGLLADASNRLIEGTMSNVFVVKNGLVATPDLSRCGVVGAQRERIRELLEAEGVDCLVHDVPFGEIEQCDEVFLSNSLIGIWPVRRLDERQWTPGPLTRRLQALIERDDAQGA